MKAKNVRLLGLYPIHAYKNVLFVSNCVIGLIKTNERYKSLFSDGLSDVMSLILSDRLSTRQ